VAWAVWVTGLPGSGKSTVARIAADELRNDGIRVRVLELDAVRKVITPEPTYSQEEREMAYAALAYMAKVLTEEGINVIIDATGNLRKYREKAKLLIKDYGEIYVSCPIDVCMAREASRKQGAAPKDIYTKGLTGKSATVPGINVPYEMPLDPIAVIDTKETTPSQAGKMAADAIKSKFR
jgi:adenylylsulfate kinase